MATLNVLSCSNFFISSSITPYPACVPLSANRFLDKITPNVLNNKTRNPVFSSFASLPIVLPAAFINKADFQRDAIISMISPNSLFEIINDVVRYAK